MPQDRDPWAAPSKDNNSSNPSSGNNSKTQDAKQPNSDPNHSSNEQSPPDLEEVFSNLLKKLGGGSSSSNNNENNNSSINFKKVAKLAVIIGALLWGASGFYTIKEGERGVVTRFGELHSIVQPGLNWKPTFIDNVISVNVGQVRSLQTQGAMLTQDENMVKVEMIVQYRVSDPAKYKFSVTDADNSLAQATDSALRYVIGHMTMDDVLTTGRAALRENTWKALNDIIKPYDMGLEVTDVNFQSARPPEEVKEAFDDAIKAQEDEQRYIREAEAYAREREPIARGNAQKIVEAATAYKDQVVLDAQGEVERFQRILPEFKNSPNVIKERLYIQTMENIMAKTPKVILDSGNNLTVLPVEQLLRNKKDESENSTNSIEKKPQAKIENITQSNVTTQPSQSAPITHSERQGRFN